MLTQPPVLAYPDFTRPFILHKDALQNGLGAVLYQNQDNEMRVIGYGSHTLTPAEQNYHLHCGQYVTNLKIICSMHPISLSSQIIIP